MNRRSPMFYVVWILVLLLVAIHQDTWFWGDRTLVFGFLPIGLLYHACISVAAGVVWFLATRFAWPPELAQIADENPVQGGEHS